MNKWRSVAALIIMSLALAVGDITVNYRVTDVFAQWERFEFSIDGSITSGGSLSIPECDAGMCEFRVWLETGDVSFTHALDIDSTDGTKKEVLGLPSYETGSCEVDVHNIALDDEEKITFYDEIACQDSSKGEMIYEFILENEPGEGQAQAKVKCWWTNNEPFDGKIEFTVQKGSENEATGIVDCVDGEAEFLFPASKLNKGLNSIIIDPVDSNQYNLCIVHLDASKEIRSFIPIIKPWEGGSVGLKSYIATINLPVRRLSTGNMFVTDTQNKLRTETTPRDFAFGCTEFDGIRVSSTMSLGSLTSGNMAIFFTPVLDGCGANASPPTLIVPSTPTGKVWLGNDLVNEGTINGTSLDFTEGTAIHMISLEGEADSTVGYYSNAEMAAPVSLVSSFFSAHVTGTSGVTDPYDAISKGLIFNAVPGEISYGWCMGVTGIRECPPSPGFTKTYSASELDGRELSVTSYGGRVSMNVSCSLTSTPTSFTVNERTLTPGQHIIPYSPTLSITADRAGTADVSVTLLGNRTDTVTMTASHDAASNVMRYTLTIMLKQSDEGAWVTADLGLDPSKVRTDTSTVICGATSRTLNYTGTTLTLSPEDVAACMSTGGVEVSIATTECLAGDCPSCTELAGGDVCRVAQADSVLAGTCCGGTCLTDGLSGDTCGVGQCVGTLACNATEASWYCASAVAGCCDGDVPGTCDAEGVCQVSPGGACAPKCLGDKSDKFVTFACRAGVCEEAEWSDCGEKGQSCMPAKGCVSCTKNDDCGVMCDYNAPSGFYSHVTYTCENEACVPHGIPCGGTVPFCTPSAGCRGCDNATECRSMFGDSFVCRNKVCDDTKGDGVCENALDEYCDSSTDCACSDEEVCNRGDPRSDYRGCFTVSCNDTYCDMTVSDIFLEKDLTFDECAKGCKGCTLDVCGKDGACTPASGERCDTSADCACALDEVCMPGDPRSTEGDGCIKPACDDSICDINLTDAASKQSVQLNECVLGCTGCNVTVCAADPGCNILSGEDCSNSPDCRCGEGALCGPDDPRANDAGCYIRQCGDGVCDITLGECTTGCMDCNITTCLADVTCNVPVGENCDNTADQCACPAGWECRPDHEEATETGCYNEKCGNGVCEPDEGECAGRCLDCGVGDCIGDGECSAFHQETCGSAAKDCSCTAGLICGPEREGADLMGCVAPFCGDGACEAGEDSIACCDDCGCDDGFACTARRCGPVCGDGNVVAGETAATCCKDVGCSDGYTCTDDGCVSRCGDGVCTEDEGWEDCCTDCGCLDSYECTAGVCIPICGDGVCTSDESGDACCVDCGCTEGQRCKRETLKCVPACGDGTCELSDSLNECAVCRQDCTVDQCAKNGRCDTEVGEHCSNSPDCSCDVSITLGKDTEVVTLSQREGGKEEESVSLFVGNVGEADEFVSISVEGPEGVVAATDLPRVLLKPDTPFPYSFNVRAMEPGNHTVTVRIIREQGPEVVRTVIVDVEARSMLDTMLWMSTIKDLLEILFLPIVLVGTFYKGIDWYKRRKEEKRLTDQYSAVQQQTAPGQQATMGRYGHGQYYGSGYHPGLTVRS